MKTYNQLKQEIQSVTEGDRPGLWDNIHAKRKRIKAGSGEHMRKPGSKGAPTAQAFKDANEETVIDEAAKGHTIEAHGIKGMKRTPWRKTFKHTDHLNDWVEKNDADVHGIRDLEQAKKGNLSPAVKEELSADEQFDLIEDAIEDLAKANNIDSEVIWKDLESIPDEELLEVAAWQRKEGKNPSGGLNQKGVDSYRRENPGSKLQTAVTTKPSKLKPGSKAANRRKSFCARMGGMKKRLTSAETARDPDSRINKALRKWNC
jgi:hypothetical protein